MADLHGLKVFFDLFIAAGQGNLHAVVPRFLALDGGGWDVMHWRIWSLFVLRRVLEWAFQYSRSFMFLLGIPFKCRGLDCKLILIRMHPSGVWEWWSRMVAARNKVVEIDQFMVIEVNIGSPALVQQLPTQKPLLRSRLQFEKVSWIMLLYLLTKDQLISSLADVDGRRGTRTLHLELLREPGGVPQFSPCPWNTSMSKWRLVLVHILEDMREIGCMLIDWMIDWRLTTTSAVFIDAETNKLHTVFDSLSPASCRHETRIAKLWGTASWKHIMFVHGQLRCA